MNNKKLANIFVLLAAALWGITGFFVSKLGAHGFSSENIVMLRLGIAAVCMIPVVFLSGVSAFKFKLKDIWCFIGTGIISQLLFNVCYFHSISVNTLSVAAILLYTAPAFVVVLSFLLFKEKITLQKTVCLVIMLVGCFLVSNVTGGASFSLKGLLLGLGSGIGYALYSIFCRYALNKGYKSVTITFYTFLFAFLGSLFINKPVEVAVKISGDVTALIFAVASAVFCSVLPYLFYTKGLEGTENSTASILATAEPMVAGVIGIGFLGDKPNITSVIGIITMMAGIIIMNINFRKISKE